MGVQQVGRTFGRWLKRNRDNGLIIALVAAIFALGGTYLGSYMNAAATERGAEISARAGAETESREQRTAAYTDYLSVTSAFAQLLLTPLPLPAGEAPPLPEVVQLPVSGGNPGANPYSEFGLRTALRDTLNKVYIYGSDDAWQKANALAEFLTGVADTSSDPAKRTFDQKKHAELVNGFRSVFCREAAAIPREKC